MDNQQNQQFVVSLLVSNHFGVLTRVSGLFARRGFNIESLTVGVTEDPNYSRMTIISQGDQYIREQIVKQLRKLEDVKVVQLMRDEQILLRELLIIKVKLTPGKLSELVEAANTFPAKIVDLSPDSILIDIIGETGKLIAFMEYYKPFGIIEMTRTGPTAIGRSVYCLTPGEQTAPLV
ncbi:MAG: acetolactate synthase small subunit [Clostridiales bacterium]|nr:acetolactate synthase small subunit [Clostridiales bacterium]